MRALKLVTTDELTKWIESNLWEHPSHYAGETYYDYVEGLGRSRDSEILELSNFDCALELLGGESETVLVVRAGHWACGWVEQILVNKSDIKACSVLKGIRDNLESYPVLDEMDFSEREYEYFQEYAEQAKTDLAHAIQVHFDLPESCSEDSDLLELAFELNMQCQFYAGSCIKVYAFREPDQFDWDRFVTCLGRCEHQDENPYFDYLLTALGMEN